MNPIITNLKNNSWFKDMHVKFKMDKGLKLWISQ